MDKAYNHKDVEGRIYKDWEEKGYFKPEINPQGKPFTIILPPPNANGALHFGHAMFAIEDILIRYHRMKGEAALWLPGSDHAGIETQFVFEKRLKDQGKSRLDFDRDTLYKMINEYVNEHRGGIENQLRSLGFSLDWSREKYTLDPDIVKIVYKTFKKMYDEGLAYRDYKLVNYCTFDGTSFSDLEVVNVEREGTLYHIKFPIKNGGFITIATTRPETLVGDVAVMVNPKDARYKDLIGKTVVLPIADREIPIIADEYVDMKFGTGAVKVTPSHDFNDYEIAKKHKLSFPPIIGMDGKMKNVQVLEGLYVKQARVKVVEMLKDKNLLEKEEKHAMVLRTCYKCKNVLEPLPLEQWFVKVASLKEKAIEAVKNGDIKITPKNFETIYFQWMENLRDWNISRQIVWGIRIPAWQCNNCHPEYPSGTSLASGSNNWIVTDGEEPEKCPKCGSKDLVQD
ncbi:MAG: class I tRNA ligase family protein, partial [bacterium]|nr:class I tRNA ligase family protein [bacterium]